MTSSDTLAASGIALEETERRRSGWRQRLGQAGLRVAWILTIGAYVGLAFSHLCPSDFSSTRPPYLMAAWTAVMIRTFAFHLGLGLTAMFAVAASLRRWRLTVTLVPPLLLTLGPVATQYLPKRTAPITGNALTFMSLNLAKGNQDVAAVVAAIESADPDILALQEFTPRWHAALAPRLVAGYPHAFISQGRGARGQALYSRVPFVGSPCDDVAFALDGVPQQRAIVRIDGRDVVLYNVHLLHPSRPTRCARRRLQFAALLMAVDAEELPVIVAGDFNAASGTPYTDALADRGFVDAHDLSGHGRGSTWPAYQAWALLPGIRIDHVFLSRDLTSRASFTAHPVGSDHRPVIAEIGFAGTPRQAP